MAGLTRQVAATIANGASLSGPIPLFGQVPYALMLDTTMTAANFTFQGTVDGTTYGVVSNQDGTDYTLTNTYTAATSGVVRAIPIDGSLFAGFSAIKVQSGAIGSPTNQGGARALQLGLREL